ncbi:MAG TPA: DUF3160 domain-containing protein [Spirochaetota bacterium]|nr:DUF3160 domain-containing protein [Spirochaetota bacterium]HNT12590.1 DUF3160 domain-containing protein [Spirochaetota bacterium]
MKRKKIIPAALAIGITACVALSCSGDRTTGPAHLFAAETKGDRFWENPSGEVPGKMYLRCAAVPFKSKQALLATPVHKRYKCTEYAFNGAERSHLNNTGFYLKRVNPTRLAYITYDDMVDLYMHHAGAEKPRAVVELTEEDSAPSYAMAPVFITADYLLHAYHLIFMRMVEDIETNKFYPIIRALTESLLAESLTHYARAKEGRLRDVYRRIAAYFAVPAAIMKIPVSDRSIQGFIAAELAGIQRAAGVSRSAISGEEEDFTQYTPRGHYNKSETLRTYFKVMMWYGRIYFPATRPLEGMIISTLLSKKANREKWEAIYTPTSFLVGESDDLTFLDYASAITTVFGASFNPNAYPDAGKLKEMAKVLKGMRNPRIISIGVRDSAKVPTHKEAQDKTKGFRFMGQRFIPDSYVFTMLTSPRVGSDAHPRNMPKGLDVMAVLGSKDAEAMLATDKKNVPRYKETFGKLKDEFGALNNAAWRQNVYWRWLDSFRSLIQEHPAPASLPAFARTPEWRLRLLLAAHGSWAELRHDTILYAKQSYAEMGGPEPVTIYYAGQPAVPRGYVEPNPVFFGKVRALAGETARLIGTAGVLTDEYKQKLAILERFSGACEALARKQEKGAAMGDDDFLWIANASRELQSIVLPNQADHIEQQYKKMALIADVHTDAAGGQVLEVGVGLPREMFVFVKDANGARPCIGYTFSYYEFAHPMNDRMTDEAWRAKAYDPAAKKYLADREPAWVKKIPSVD